MLFSHNLSMHINRDSHGRLYLWLTPAGFLFLGETCALIALHGKPARCVARSAERNRYG